MKWRFITYIMKTGMLLLLCLSLCMTAAFGAEAVETADENLLVNTHVEDSLEGWTVSSADEPLMFRGESILRSGIYQDVPLEETSKGLKLKLSAQIAVAPDDPDQLVAEMGLTFCDAAGTVITDTQMEQETGREPVLHEIVAEVPEGAAFARVCLAIYKRSARNAFCCEGLCLERMDALTNLNIPADAVTWNGHFYYYYEDPEISWTMAENYCGISHGHLVTIASAEEQAFLESAFPGTGGWIGASIREDGNWQWVTDEVLDYTNWNDGEPDNKNETEGCARFSANMKWEDLPNEDTASHTGYYCEWDSNLVAYARNGTYDETITEETRALLEEGKGCYYGTGPDGYDLGRAWECFSAATEDQSAEAWYYLGRIMASGRKDTGKDPYIRAMGAYEKAVTYGFLLGWAGQADLYLNGQGVPVDYDRARQLYQRAIDQGCKEAYFGMGRLYQYGLGVEADGVKAVECYQKAAESEEPGWRNMARNALGNLYYEGCAGIPADYSLAVDWYMKGAQEGDGPCCNNLGYMYYQGDGTEQDYSQAAYWFEMAASRGERDGCYNIAYLYENGIGVEQDYALALEYYKKAALMGDVWAMYFLGHLYEEGLGTEIDYVLAREWYQKVLQSADVNQELKDTIEGKLAEIQAAEEAALAAMQETAPAENWNQYYSPFGEATDGTAIDYSTFGWTPDGTIDYGTFEVNPDGTFTTDPAQNISSPETTVNVDDTIAETPLPEETAGTVPEAAPEVVPETVPEVVPEAVPEPVPADAAGTEAVEIPG